MLVRQQQSANDRREDVVANRTDETGTGEIDAVPSVYMRLVGEEYVAPHRSKLRRAGALGFAALAIAAGGMFLPADDALADDGSDDDATASEPSLDSATDGATVSEPSTPSVPSEASVVTSPSEPSAASDVSQPSAVTASVSSPRERE